MSQSNTNAVGDYFRKPRAVSSKQKAMSEFRELDDVGVVESMFADIDDIAPVQVEQKRCSACQEIHDPRLIHCRGCDDPIDEDEFAMVPRADIPGNYEPFHILHSPSKLFYVVAYKSYVQPISDISDDLKESDMQTNTTRNTYE